MAVAVRDLLEEKRFVFNGTASTDFRLIVSGGGTFGAPKREYETVDIPGRSGSLLIDKGYWDDAEITYKGVGFIPERLYPGNMDLRLAAVRSWLLSPLGYRRLEDTWHPDEYRMAYVSSDFDPSLLSDLEAGTVDIKFTAKPQRFLKIGEDEITVTNGMQLVNPTVFPAYPLINVVGNGTVTFANADGTFSCKVTRNATIDCDFMNVYNGRENLNYYATFTLPSTDETKMHLADGLNTITYSGFSKVTMIPRWWRL